MISGFRDFVMRGNVVDLAVAFVLGAAFASVVTAFVTGILTPLLGLVGVPDFSQLRTELPSGAVIEWGLFLNALIAFVLIAAAIYFFVVVPMNRLRPPPPTPAMKNCPECTSSIPESARRCPQCTAQLASTTAS
ncbi:MAG TPA: large conductance mechanosensitive channel protein MscL [Candidatus Limnocylindria bacterium]|jgi:large conductance mechanosensitive channel|nr:large conductance mechanosensitive channel protein MscL [Candidatus Limnocylindria bacterium]